jgi:hypothetical protein
MPIDPATLKPDSRSPKDLAQAILDHEFTPKSPAFDGVTFREQLEYNADDHYHQSARLLWPLKHLAAGRPLSPFSQRDLSHGLQVLAAYEADSAESRDILAMHATPDMRPRNEYQQQARRGHLIHGRPPEDAQREAQEDMANAAIEINNLKLIERLLRALAAHPDVNVKLIQPRRGRA